MRLLKNDRTRVKWLDVSAQKDGASDMDWGIYNGSEIIAKVGQGYVRV